MNVPVGRNRVRADLTVIVVCAAVLVGATFLGLNASLLVLGLLGVVIGAVTLLALPVLDLFVVVLSSLLVRQALSTGTEVDLNAVSLLIPALAVLWMLDMARRQQVRFVPSRANLPLFLFLAAGLLSLLIGRAIWDPLVPLKGNFLLVQLAQWAIFAFSAVAFWMCANLVRDERWLKRLTFFFLLLGGSLAVLRFVPGVGGLIGQVTTFAFFRVPFWVLLAALAGGQLLFNRRLKPLVQLFLLAIVSASLVYAFAEQREAVSTWVGIGAALGVLVWLRFPRIRIPLIVVVLLLAAAGLFIPAVYKFAGGDAEWRISGGSRLALIQRVVEVTMRNPITGLGPAAYRAYASTTPLIYLRAFWVAPQINSHNNYVDLFAHVGIVGLALFAWFAAELTALGVRLHRRFATGFAAGYVNAMLAAGAGALVIMLLADWMLPFIYNIGFPGFQASVLVWLFLGGLVALDNMPVAAEQ